MTIKFDHAIDKHATQKEVFELFEESIARIPEGFNMTVFAYGQTGSGKTHTMFGGDWEYSVGGNGEGGGSNNGKSNGSNSKSLQQQQQNGNYHDTNTHPYTKKPL